LARERKGAAKDERNQGNATPTDGHA
jgi:hypothetical protein